MAHGEVKAKRWRPWQFSLQAILLLTLLVATFLGGWLRHVRDLNKMVSAGDEIVRLGGTIRFDKPTGLLNGNVMLPSAVVIDTLTLEEEPRLRMKLTVGLIDVAPVLSQMRTLRSLKIYGVGLNERSIGQLGHLARLECLELEGNKVNGDCLGFLKELKNLKRLSLRDNHLTDVQVSTVIWPDKLEEVYLDISEISGTDPTWIDRFTQLKSLRILSLCLVADDDNSLPDMEAQAKRMRLRIALHGINEALPLCDIRIEARELSYAE